MKILMVGGGGREHALVWKLLQSPRVREVHCAPGNGGTARIARNADIAATDVAGMTAYAKKEKFDLVFVASDDPLALGMVDAMEAAGIRAFGPRKNAAVIEGSKVFAKNLMKKYGIPTADYEAFDEPEAAKAYVRRRGGPVAVKADGLALGKGVIICQTVEEAEEAIDTIMVEKKFKTSGARVVIEEYMTGHEVTVLCFTDGKTIVQMVSSQDHKRIFDNDEGPNTGGMGAIAPSPRYSPELSAVVQKRILEPVVHAMNAEGRPFKGVLYAELMLTGQGPRVIEFNARFGDPEAQAVLPLLETDLIGIIDAVLEERLAERPIEWAERSAATVVMASGGYPGAYPKGLPIRGIESAEKMEDVTVFHAGTACRDGVFYTNGGRVLGVTAAAGTLTDAVDRAYEAVARIRFEGAHWRTDIGRR